MAWKSARNWTSIFGHHKWHTIIFVIILLKLILHENKQIPMMYKFNSSSVCIGNASYIRYLSWERHLCGSNYQLIQVNHPATLFKQTINTVLSTFSCGQWTFLCRLFDSSLSEKASASCSLRFLRWPYIFLIFYFTVLLGYVFVEQVKNKTKSKSTNEKLFKLNKPSEKYR